jgi:uncharacterized phiE125 gp8 family phage protein
MTSTVVTTAPTTEPVSIDDVKEQLVIGDYDDDQLLSRLIVTARTVLERRSWGAFINQTLTTRVDNGWPPQFWLPRWPLSSVTSIAYLDGNGDSQTLATSEYTVDANTRPGRVVPAYSATWPTVRSVENSISVTYVAGHGSSAADVPEPIKDAIILYVGFMYANRDGGCAGDEEEAIQRSLSRMADYVVHDSKVLEFV